MSGLSAAVGLALIDVPFLLHYRRATQISDRYPYQEIAQYCKVHRERVEQVFATLRYFDGVNFAARARAEALFSVGLMDEVCPPSTVYAAYNHYGGPKRICCYEYNGHEGGESYQVQEKLGFVTARW